MYVRVHNRAKVVIAWIPEQINDEHLKHICTRKLNTHAPLLTISRTDGTKGTNASILEVSITYEHSETKRKVPTSD